MSTIDVVYSVDRFPTPNSKVSAEAQDVFAGGPATNAAIAFHHLGGKATLVTVMGCHPAADLAREELQQQEVEIVDLFQEFNQLPVISSIAVNPAGERNIISANARGLTLPSLEIDMSVLAQSSVLMVDGHYMSAAQAWAGAAQTLGIEVVLDGGSWKDGTEQLLETVDTAICSADFSPPGCSGDEAVIRYLESSGVKRVAITKGSEAIAFRSRAQGGVVPVPRVEVVDTMGAGDVFHGAYCYYSTIGVEFEEALRKAAVIAAESCRYRGTREWMRHVSEIKMR